MNRRLERRRFVVSGQKTFAETIELSGDALGMELGVTSELGFAVQTVRGAYSLLYIRGCRMQRALVLRKLRCIIEKNWLSARRETDKLSQKVIECPVVVFFLTYYVFEYAPCFAVAALHCLFDDFPVQH